MNKKMSKIQQDEQDHTPNTRSILVVRDVCIMPIVGNKDELEAHFGPEKTDLSVFPEDFLDAYIELSAKIDSLRMYAMRTTKVHTTTTMLKLAQYFCIHFQHVFTDVSPEMIDENWFTENGKRNAIYRACTLFGDRYGYHVSGECAVKLINCIDGNKSENEFKFYLGRQEDINGIDGYKDVNEFEFYLGRQEDIK